MFVGILYQAPRAMCYLLHTNSISNPLFAGCRESNSISVKLFKQKFRHGIYYLPLKVMFFKYFYEQKMIVNFMYYMLAGVEM